MANRHDMVARVEWRHLILASELVFVGRNNNFPTYYSERRQKCTGGRYTIFTVCDEARPSSRGKFLPLLPDRVGIPLRGYHYFYNFLVVQCPRGMELPKPASALQKRSKSEKVIWPVFDAIICLKRYPSPSNKVTRCAQPSNEQWKISY